MIIANDDTQLNQDDNQQGQEAKQKDQPETDNDIVVTKDGETHTGTHKKRKYIIEYQRDVCIGAASCAMIAALTFQMDDENKAFIIEEGEWDDEEIILAAAQSCPVFAIIVKDAETGEQIFPIP
jgi:ferredoxin